MMPFKQIGNNKVQNKICQVILICILVEIVNSTESNQLSISANVNRFGLRLLQDLSDGKSNVFQSPFSIAAAMTMLIGTNGNTFKEIKNTLGYTKNTSTIKKEWKSVFKTLNQNEGVNVLAVGNKLIVKENTDVKENYKKDLKWFDAEIDLNQKDIVGKTNEWVKKKTKGMIEEMLSKDIGEINLVILNAIFFQGVWQDEFDKKDTNMNGTFYNHGTTEKKVAMMYKQLEVSFKHYDDFGGFKIIHLAYKKPQKNSKPKLSEPNINMVILLPDNFTKLQKLVNKMTIDKLNKFRIDASDSKVNVYLPRFKLQTDYKLIKHLEKMGIKDAFDPSKADLSATSNNELSVSDVIHKAAIEVDERGTKAAAATAVVVVEYSEEEEQEIFEFRADHPFLYFIIDDSTGIILFAGTVNTL